MTNAPAYDPKETRYWDKADLFTEQKRQYKVCDDCRLCWNLCPTFPALFETSEKHEHNFDKITTQELDGIEQFCFQCKLCWVVCPYTSPHEYNLDVPRLIQRSKFVRAKDAGVGIGKKLVGDQDRLGKMAGGMMAPLTNLANSFGPARAMSSVVTGVHPKANLPRFHAESFEGWFKKRHGAAMKPSASPVKKVAFFASCTVNYNNPEIGRACMAIFEHNNVEVVMPEQQCCGMPMMDIGDHAGARKKTDFNLRRLSALVDQGYDIVTPGPTCSYTAKNEWEEMSSDLALARKVSERMFEMGQYLVQLAREKVLLRDFKVELGQVNFHVACHTRAQAMGNPTARLLGIIPGTTVTSVEACSGHDGVWGVSKQYFPLALKVGKKLYDNMKEGDAAELVTDCPLAARHIEIGTGRRPVHSSQVIAKAYGLADSK